LILGEKSSKEAAVTAFSLARSMKKTPIVLRDGSRGFLVNAILAELIRSCEALLNEGVSIERLDSVLTAAGMPQGFGVLMDAVGIDTVDGMMRFLGQESALARRLVEAGRLGRKSGGGFYDYDAPGPRSASKGVWHGLSGLLASGPRVVSDAELVERPFRAMFDRAKELLDRGIVDSKETADLAMILGLGLPVYLGGIFYEGQGRGWDR
jgi:3-hydroxyacyl-CoA dehydrogenase